MNLPRKILEKCVFVFVFIIVLLGVYFSRTNLPFYEGVFVREDSFVEWLTVLALLVGIIMNVYRAYILKPFRSPLFIFCLYAFALIFFFGLAEEISWGQRIFNIKSPEFFLKYNTQGEFNFHNLRFGNFKVNRYIFGTFLGILVGIYFLILPILYQKVEKIKELINKFALPMPQLYHIVAYLILAALVNMIDGGKKGEILEFGGCWIFLLMFFEPLNREIFSRKSFKR